jgi:hypothetical protein
MVVFLFYFFGTNPSLPAQRKCLLPQCYVSKGIVFLYLLFVLTQKVTKKSRTAQSLRVPVPANAQGKSHYHLKFVYDRR